MVDDFMVSGNTEINKQNINTGGETEEDAFETYHKSSRKGLRSNRDLLLKNRIELAAEFNNEILINLLTTSGQGKSEKDFISHGSSYLNGSPMAGSSINQATNVMDVKSINIGNASTRKNYLSLSGVKNNMRTKDPSKPYKFMTNKGQNLSNNSPFTNGLLGKINTSENSKSKTLNDTSKLSISTKDNKRRNKSYPFELTYHKVSAEMPNHVYIDLSYLPGCKEGDLIELKTYTKQKSSVTESAKLDIKNSFTTAASIESLNHIKHSGFTNANRLIGTSETTAEARAKNNRDKKLFFIAKNFPDLYNRRTKNPQISLSYDDYHKILGLSIRSTVYTKIKDKVLEQCDLVEVMVKDCYVNRGDMWLIRNKINATTVNLNQRLIFLNSLRMHVSGVYKEGKKIYSGYIGDDTKVIIRSESARFFFVIQITEEMWQFEEDGEVMFQKVVNSLFPKILKKWKKIGTNHNISVIFTATVDVEDYEGGEDITASIPGYKSSNNKDYYRIVVDEVNITHWRNIMDTLRQEFMDFKRDLLNIKSDDGKYFIQGKLAPCVKTNILESINMVATVLLNPFRQMDLRHTTTHIMIISPGAGLFDVDYDLLKFTTKKLLSLEVTIDIICLATPPMHIVPLFRYIDNTDSLRFCVPTWLSISFWNEASRKYGDWKPSCKIYDLQVLNLTEYDFKPSSMLKDLPNVANIKKIDNFVEHYDKNIFALSDDSIKLELKNTLGYFDMTKKIYKEHRTSISGLSLQSNNSNMVKNETKYEKSSVPKFIWKNNIVQKPSVQKIDTIQVTASKENIEEEKKSNYSEAINTLKTVKSNAHLPKIAQTFSNFFNNRKASYSYYNDDIDNKQSNFFDSGSKKVILEVNDSGSNENLGDISKRASPMLKSQQKLFSSHSSANNSSSMFRAKTTNDDELVKHSKNKKSTKFQYDYWISIENPSTSFDPERADDLISQRWKHVYPKLFAKNTSKWRSFTTPADLPVTTDVCPSISQYVEHYELRNYSVSLDTDIKLFSLSNSDFVLMRNLIYARLVAGFQIIQNMTQLKSIEENYLKTSMVDPVNILNDPHSFKNKAIYMLGNDEIHRICCNSDSVIEIRQYINKTDKISDFKVLPNNSMIKTRYESEYRKANLDTLNAFRPYVNWNQFDQFLAGYSESDDVTTASVYEFKSKFCVLSTDVPEYTTKTYGKEHLDSEEIRLEGLRKLISVLYRLRVRSEKEKKNSRKEEILPEIFFYTGSLQNFIMSQKDSLRELILDNLEDDNIETSFSNGTTVNDLGLTTKSDLKKIAYELQYGEHKLNLCTRSWRWINYKDSLVGSSLVNWLLKYFKDIETRDQAVSFGNFLMENGVIKHVLQNHGFLDGNYYYVIGPDFRDIDDYISEKSLQNSNISKKDNHYSLASRKSPPSFAPLLSIKSVHSNHTMTIDSKLQNDSKTENKDELVDDIATTPTISLKNKLQIMLSSCLKIDLDPLKESSKPQILTVHFDRAHNPDHCFHIRFEWVTTTPRLVDDLITSLSKTAESYGLRLVEIPWEEMINISTFNPFHSSVYIDLALNPFTDLSFKDCEIIQENKFYFHMWFLENEGFLLDNRGSNFFDKNSEDSKTNNFKYEIIYSWGKQTFKNAQFLHKTGAYIAELLEDGRIFLAPNNLHLSRVNIASSSNRNRDDSLKSYVDSQKVMIDFKATCGNYELLKKIFEEGKEIWYSNQKMAQEV